MKITIYTISNDPFCNQEKDFLTSKGLQFEEKNVQENREFLTEMLNVSNKFAGVPFTMIEKDNGEKVSLKGFTQSEFEQALGGSSTGGSVAAPTSTAPTTQPASTATPVPTPAAMPAAPTPTTSSMPDPVANMPSMPSIDEAPQSNVPGSPTAPAAPTAPMPSMSTPPVAPASSAPTASMPSPTPTTSTPPPAPTNSAPTSTPPPAGNTQQAPQNQLDGILADLQTKAQPDLPDFPAQGGQASTQQ